MSTNRLSVKSTKILGVKIDKVRFVEAVEKAKQLIKSGNKSYIVTPNPEIIVAAQKDNEFKNILNKSSLSIADGMGLVWLSKLFRNGIPERVTGIDLLEALMEEAEKNNFSVFLLGGNQGVAEKAAQSLKSRYPDLKIVGTFAGSGGKEGDREVLRKIGQSQIDILAVGYGPVKQEKWIDRNLQKLNVKLAIGVGGSLDFISGYKKRAPVWIQKAGFEWLFRLILEPWRWKRQLALPGFVCLFLVEKLVKLVKARFK